MVTKTQKKVARKVNQIKKEGKTRLAKARSFVKRNPKKTVAIVAGVAAAAIAGNALRKRLRR